MINRKKRKITANFVLTPSGIDRDIILTFEDDGTISAIEKTSDQDSVANLEYYNGIIIPGMFNCHCHLELSYLRGILPKGEGFTNFAHNISASRNSFDVQAKEKDAASQDKIMWQQGISFVADICNDDITFGIKQKSSVRYLSLLESYGLKKSNFSKCLSLSEQGQQLGLDVSITPHSLYSVNDSLLEEIEGANPNGILSIHFLESENEKELYNKEGNLWKWYESAKMDTDFIGRYAGIIDRLLSKISPERKVLLVHNTFIEESEVGRIVAHFRSNATFVLCPRSNIYIENKLPPFELLYQMTDNVFFGTDSLASNTSLSLIGELKTVRGVKLEKLLTSVTSMPARFFGMEDMGSFDTGKRPGAVLIENADLRNLKLLPETTTRRIV